MLIGPRGVAARSVDHGVNRVRADELPRVNRGAVVKWIAGQLRRVDGLDATIYQAVTRETAIELALVDLNTFLVLGGGGVGFALNAIAAGKPIAGRIQIGRASCRERG